MNWATIRTTLADVVETVTGIDDAQISWKGTTGNATWSRYPQVEMSVRSIIGVGRDEERHDSEAGDPIGPDTVTISGVRQLVWTVRIESQNAADTAIANNYADRLRTRLKRQSVRDTLNAAGLAVSFIQPAQQVDFKSQDRWSSVEVIDVMLNAVENDTDDTTDAGTTVGTVEMRSEYLADPSDDVSPVQIGTSVNENP